MLNRRITMYVPGTVNNKPNAKAQEEWVEKALDKYADLFGGATAMDKCRGAWKTGSGLLVKEPVVLVYAFTDEAGLEQHRQDVERFAQQMAAEMMQECVSVEIDGELQFIEPQQQAA